MAELSNKAVVSNPFQACEKKDNIRLASGNMWNIQDHYQIINDNQGGIAGDHRLKVQSGRVSCDGLNNAENVNFKIYSAAFPTKNDRGVDYVFMLECTGGDSDHNMICLKNDEVYTKKRVVDYKTWEDAEKDVLFRKIPRSETSVYDIYESYHCPGQYLGFDLSGKVIKPSKVNIAAPEAWFLAYPSA